MDIDVSEIIAKCSINRAINVKNFAVHNMRTAKATN